jgi:septum formation protein
MECLKSPKIILASASSRRHELLGGLFGGFEIRLPDVDEHSDFLKPYKIVEDIAQKKAFALDNLPGELIIPADTTV